MKVSAIQITKERFFCPSDWLASCQFRRPPSNAPMPKLTMQITSEIRAIVSRVKVELEFSLRRKLEALALMIKRLISQMRKENDFPLRINPCVADGKRETSCARSNGTNMTISTGSKTAQIEI